MSQSNAAPSCIPSASWKAKGPLIQWLKSCPAYADQDEAKMKADHSLAQLRDLAKVICVIVQIVCANKLIFIKAEITKNGGKDPSIKQASSALSYKPDSQEEVWFFCF
jgi:hypothetical protein